MQILTNQFQKEVKEHGNYQYPFRVSLEKLSRYDSGSFLWHWHPELELTYIIKGEMVYQVHHLSFHLKEGDAFFCNSNALHSGIMFQNQDCEYYSVTFDAKLIYGYENSLIYNQYMSCILMDLSFPCIHFSQEKEWYQNEIRLIKDILCVFHEKNTGYEMQINSILLDFWKILFLNKNSAPAFSFENTKNDERMRKILQYISLNYTNKITLDDISKEIYLCTSECSRLFKKYMNMPLFEYILQYRIEMSLPYLLDTTCTMTQIAEKCGFYDSNYYAKTFHKIKGCSPKVFRNNILKNSLETSP